LAKGDLVRRSKKLSQREDCRTITALTAQQNGKAALRGTYREFPYRSEVKEAEGANRDSDHKDQEAGRIQDASVPEPRLDFQNLWGGGEVGKDDES